MAKAKAGGAVVVVSRPPSWARNGRRGGDLEVTTTQGSGTRRSVQIEVAALPNRDEIQNMKLEEIQESVMQLTDARRATLAADLLCSLPGVTAIPLTAANSQTQTKPAPAARPSGRVGRSRRISSRVS